MSKSEMRRYWRIFSMASEIFIKKPSFWILSIIILISACFYLSTFSSARHNFDRPDDCRDLNFHWNCCEINLSGIPEIKSSELQNMIIMDWSTFSLEQNPPYETFSKFHLAVTLELKSRGDMTIFTPGEFNQFYKLYKKRSKR